MVQRGCLLTKQRKRCIVHGHLRQHHLDSYGIASFDQVAFIDFSHAPKSDGMINLINSIEARARRQSWPHENRLRSVRVHELLWNNRRVRVYLRKQRALRVVSHDNNRHIINGTAVEREHDQAVACLL